MRIRTIKPEFWSSVDIAALSRDTRLTFIGMWNFVSDNGVGQAHVRLIASSLYPLDDPVEASTIVRRSFDELSTIALVTLYERGGRTYFKINSFGDHQRVDRPNYKRALPDLDDQCRLVTCDDLDGQQLVEPSTNVRRNFDEGSTIVRDRSREQGRDQGEGGCGGETASSPETASGTLGDHELPGAGAPSPQGQPSGPGSAKRKTPARSLPESWEPNDSHRDKANKAGLDVDHEAEQFRAHAAANDRRQANWDQAFTMWLGKASEFAPKRKPRRESAIEGW